MTGNVLKDALVVAAPASFAALADELQMLAGNNPKGGPDTASANGQHGNFTAAERERVQKLFEPFEELHGKLDGSLSDGIETDIEEIRSAVSAIPSSAISSEANWMKFARALAHEAAIYKKQSDELWEVLDTASRPAPGYDEPDNRARWLRYIREAFARENPITIATVFDLAKKHGWQRLSSPGAPEDQSDPGEATTGPTASPPPELKFSLSDIPPHRAWLYGVDLLRGDLSVLASTGGAGKTSLAVGMAISLASGNSLLGEKIWGSGALKSLYINAEDSGIEMRRRALAYCQQHNITVLDRLYIAGTDDPRVRGLSFLSPAGQNSSVLDQAGLAHLDNLLASLLPDLVVIDPLIALCGGGNVNDNAAMALVMREIKRLAIKFNCSILIVHHTRKGGEPGSAEAISGASAIKDLARCARMPVTMTAAEMGIFRVLPSERLRYFKLVDAKSNLALHSDETWYKLESQELPNAGAPYPHGDRVQAVVRVQLSVEPGGSANADDMKIEAAILKVVESGKEIDGQAYPYSPSLAGASNQRALLPDAMAAVANATAPRHWAPGDLEATIKTAINKMLADGRLVVKNVEDLIPKPGRFRRRRGLKAVPI
jgi:AAA domain/Primase C terminal 2 (PriCT-2)